MLKRHYFTGGCKKESNSVTVFGILTQNCEMSDIQFKNPFMYFWAMLFSLPNVVIIWFVVMYPVYGLTGEALHPFFHIFTCTMVFLVIWSWTLLGSQKNFEITYRSCRLGAILALLLPVSAGLTSLFWIFDVTERPDTFLSGYSALEIPALALAAAMLIILLFLTGSYVAARNMEGIPF
jgi:hypothetical protein